MGSCDWLAKTLRSDWPIAKQPDSHWLLKMLHHHSPLVKKLHSHWLLRILRPHWPSAKKLGSDWPFSQPMGDSDWPLLFHDWSKALSKKPPFHWSARWAPPNILFPDWSNSPRFLWPLTKGAELSSDWPVSSKRPHPSSSYVRCDWLASSRPCLSRRLSLAAAGGGGAGGGGGGGGGNAAADWTVQSRCPPCRLAEEAQRAPT